MAVIHFTDADKMQTTIIEAGIYPSMVTKLEGPTKSGSGKSNNYFCDIMITDGKYKGKTRTIVFNTESNNPSLLGTMQFFPVSHMLLLWAAINNTKPESVDVDTDELMQKPFDAAWAVATVDGSLLNTITAFYPKGYGAQAPAF